MTNDRRYVLAAIVAALGAVTGAILLEVLGTIVLSITVAFVLVPVYGWLVRRGLSKWWAGVVATCVGFVGAVAVFAPIAVTVYFRHERLIDLVRELPSELTITVLETPLTIQAADVQSWAIDVLRSLALSLAGAAPELAVKFALFLLLVFALLLEGDAAVRAAIAPVPHAYRDVVIALGNRARETLYAIYVLQLATAVATTAIGYPFFLALGYENAFTMAMISGILQFVPIIGPTFLVLPVAVYHVVAGELVAAALVGVLGALVVGWLPDVLVRPRLSRRTADLPGSLYFVGFTGGLFTLGPIGIVVGPLVVAVFAEAVELLAAEVNADDVSSLVAEMETESGDETGAGGETGESDGGGPTDLETVAPDVSADTSSGRSSE